MADNSSPGETLAFRQRLNAGEQHWAWKSSLRAIIVILDIIAIGAGAWLLATDLHQQQITLYLGLYDDVWWSEAVVVAVSGASFIWCAVWILVLLLRRPPRAAHPGVAVGLDLILWIFFLISALSALAAVFSLGDYGSGEEFYGGIYNQNYDAQYVLEPDNTWVLEVTWANPAVYGANPNLAKIHISCKPYFDTCAEQTAYVNQLWHQRASRGNVAILVTAIQWINLLIHFALFVWACVDTHRYNRGLRQRDTRAMADQLLQDMQSKGMITFNPQTGMLGKESVPSAQRVPYMEMNGDVARFGSAGGVYDIAPVVTSERYA